MNIEGIVDSVIDILKAELIAKTSLTADVNAGDTTISVVNSFHFYAGQEIVFIDYGYNDSTSAHYQIFEYSVVKSVTDTTTIVLTTPIISDWLVSAQSFIQKTIAHSPLYDHNVLYGDRGVIPTDEIAITIEPVSLSNEWIYLQGGLSEESRLTIVVYGKSVETEEGLRILNKYTKAVYDILNGSLHLNVNDFQAPLTRDISVNDTQFYICNTADNAENFVTTTNGVETYAFQSNTTPKCSYYDITSTTVVGDELCLTTSCLLENEILKSDFGIAIRLKRYIYDSRVDNVTFGKIQKDSAVLRASELSWFGKEVNELSFPQLDRKTIDFDPDDLCSSSSSD
jgi:hypothetical protein